jgi:hypothetical protein
MGLETKCAAYLAKGKIQAIHEDPTFTTQTQSACNVYRIQKGLPKPPNSLGGRRKHRNKSRKNKNKKQNKRTRRR